MIVVSVTSESARALVPRTPHPERVTVRVVEHSLAELNEIYEAVTEAWLREEEGTADLAEAGVSVSRNALVVSFFEDSPSGQAVIAGDLP